MKFQISCVYEECVQFAFNGNPKICGKMRCQVRPRPSFPYLKKSSKEGTLTRGKSKMTSSKKPLARLEKKNCDLSAKLLKCGKQYLQVLTRGKRVCSFRKSRPDERS